MTVKVYPTFSEVSEELSEDELLEILNKYVEHDEDIVNEWIQENYEPECEIDADGLYDKMKDDRLTGDL